MSFLLLSIEQNKSQLFKNKSFLVLYENKWFKSYKCLLKLPILFLFFKMNF